MSGITPNTTIDIIISKLYEMQAFSNNPEYTNGFIKLMGGHKNCIVIRTKRGKLDIDDSTLENNMLYELDDIYASHVIELELDEFLEECKNEVVGSFETMLKLMNFYKFKSDDNELAQSFAYTYDLYFLEDYQGVSMFDYIEHIDLKLLLRMYLSTIKRTRE